MHAIAEAVTQCKFEATNPAADEVVLYKILQVAHVCACQMLLGPCLRMSAPNLSLEQFSADVGRLIHVRAYACAYMKFIDYRPCIVCHAAMFMSWESHLLRMKDIREGGVYTLLGRHAADWCWPACCLRAPQGFVVGQVSCRHHCPHVSNAMLCCAGLSHAGLICAGLCSAMLCWAVLCCAMLHCAMLTIFHLTLRYATRCFCLDLDLVLKPPHCSQHLPC